MVPDFWTSLGWILAFIAAIFAIKGTIKIDVNELLKRNDQRRREKFKRICPHVTLGNVDAGEDVFVSLFVSPSGTSLYVCQQCGAETYDPSLMEPQLAFWIENPDAFGKRLRQTQKFAKKL